MASLTDWSSREPVLRDAWEARVWRDTHLTVDEWRTIGLFSVVALGLSFIDTRIVYIALGAITIGILVTNGETIITTLGQNFQSVAPKPPTQGTNP